MNKLAEIRKELNWTQGKLADILRVKQNTISLIENGRNNLTYRNEQLLIERLGISAQWLKDGTGAMFSEQSPAQTVTNEPTSNIQDLPTSNRTVIPGSRVAINQSEHGVPYYNKPVTGSLLESFSDMDREPPEYYINIEPLNNCTFYRPVYGESMMPRYNPGDIVACQKITNKRTIMFGETYLCMIKSDADYYETIKVLRKNPNPALVTLKPTNPNFDETTIPIDSILQLYIIRGKIERNF